MDVPQFFAQSTTAANTSAAFSRDVSIDTIMNAAGWSREKTFSQFYLKPMVEYKSFGESLFDKFVKKM